MSDFLSSLFGAIVGSGVGSTVIQGFFQRQTDDRGRFREVADSALAAVSSLNLAYREVLAGRLDQVALGPMEAEVQAQVDRTYLDDLGDLAGQWIRFGRRFASDDFDAGEEEYEDLREALCSGLRAFGKP